MEVKNKTDLKCRDWPGVANTLASKFPLLGQDMATTNYSTFYVCIREAFKE